MNSPDELHFSLHVNGLDNAYTREFGCGCGRCLRPGRAANTSLSLLAQDALGELRHHLLFDAGSGVVESLIANPLLRQQPLLDAVLLTHWHSDHTAELTRVGVTLKRSRIRQGRPAADTPVWVRRGGLDWLTRQYPGLEKAGLTLHGFGADEPRGEMLEPLPTLVQGLTITPISISHSTADLHPQTFEPFPCCAGYLLETAQFRAALLWDLDAYNLWLLEPQQPTVQRLTDLDHVFFDSNTWTYDKNPDGTPASHASFRLIRQFAKVLQPRNTWLVHLSGHEDAEGSGFGWSDERWQLEASAAWEKEGLPGQVHVPQIGQQIKLDAG